MYLTYSQIHTVPVTLTIQNITSWQYGVRLVYIQAHAVLTDQPKEAAEGNARREATFALTRLQIAALSSPRVFFVFSFAFSLPLHFPFREAQCSTVPRASKRSQNRRLKYTTNVCLYFREGFPAP